MKCNNTNISQPFLVIRFNVVFNFKLKLKASYRQAVYCTGSRAFNERFLTFLCGQQLFGVWNYKHPANDSGCCNVGGSQLYTFDSNLESKIASAALGFLSPPVHHSWWEYQAICVCLSRVSALVMDKTPDKPPSWLSGAQTFWSKSSCPQCLLCLPEF